MDWLTDSNELALCAISIVGILTLPFRFARLGRRLGEIPPKDVICWCRLLLGRESMLSTKFALEMCRISHLQFHCKLTAGFIRVQDQVSSFLPRQCLLEHQVKLAVPSKRLQDMYLETGSRCQPCG